MCNRVSAEVKKNPCQNHGGDSDGVRVCRPGHTQSKKSSHYAGNLQGIAYSNRESRKDLALVVVGQTHGSPFQASPADSIVAVALKVTWSFDATTRNKRGVGESAFTKSGEHFRRLLDERKTPGDIKLIYLRDAIRSNGTLDGMLLRDIRSRMRFSMLSISSRLLVRRYSSQRE